MKLKARSRICTFVAIGLGLSANFGCSSNSASQVTLMTNTADQSPPMLPSSTTSSLAVPVKKVEVTTSVGTCPQDQFDTARFSSTGPTCTGKGLIAKGSALIVTCRVDHGEHWLPGGTNTYWDLVVGGTYDRWFVAEDTLTTTSPLSRVLPNC